MSTAEPVPMACTLDLQETGSRVSEIDRLTREHLRSHRVDHGMLRLTYDIAAAREVTRIVELERRCCAFLDFELTTTVDSVELAITAPEQEGTDGRVAVRTVHAWNRPARPAVVESSWRHVLPSCRNGSNRHRHRHRQPVLR